MFRLLVRQRLICISRQDAWEKNYDPKENSLVCLKWKKKVFLDVAIERKNIYLGSIARGSLFCQLTLFKEVFYHVNLAGLSPNCKSHATAMFLFLPCPFINYCFPVIALKAVHSPEFASSSLYILLTCCIHVVCLQCFFVPFFKSRFCTTYYLCCSFMSRVL